MYISCFEFFKIGIGPSSSHTIGPMVAARRFASGLQSDDVLGEVVRVQVTLLGSLAYTGKGHATDKAVVFGLANETPEGLTGARAAAHWTDAAERSQLYLAGKKRISFDLGGHLIFDTRTSTTHHPNTLQFQAFDSFGRVKAKAEYYSIGGGFVLDEDEINRPEATLEAEPVPHPFDSCAELEQRCRDTGEPIHALLLENEMAHRTRAEVVAGLTAIWAAMKECIEAGCRTPGTLPGHLNVVRRASLLHTALSKPAVTHNSPDPLIALDWVNVWAIAVNEENAAGGRVVTAPTNGAAGIIPAVYAYFEKYYEKEEGAGLLPYFLTATAIANLFKKNASISGAEVGCQGEVGVASSMAAAGLTAALGGSVQQVENAAEIAMEHSLGLTCDPVGGLVQIPCIERNAMGAVKAIDASRLALNGDGIHRVSLDQVINTMRQTGADMQTIYKETSLGGLAVNVIEC